MTSANTMVSDSLGDESAYERVWHDPFSPREMNSSRSKMEKLHQIRLTAEDAEEHFYRALAGGADPYSVKSLLFGSRWLDYAAARYQVPVEIEDRWNKLGPRPRDMEYAHYFASGVVHQCHSLIVDMMDESTELKEQYKNLWLEEYTPYRLGSTLGRWDAEYQLWRGMQQKLQESQFDPNKDLPSFRSVIDRR
jgi:hypothetical protein